MGRDTAVRALLRVSGVNDIECFTILVSPFFDTLHKVEGSEMSITGEAYLYAEDVVAVLFRDMSDGINDSRKRKAHLADHM